MQTGFTLLEVLITAFIISFGFLSLLDADIHASKSLLVIAQYRFYEQQLYSLDDALKISTHPDQILSEWKRTLSRTPPYPEIAINTESRHQYDIQIQWQFGHKPEQLKVTLYE